MPRVVHETSIVERGAELDDDVEVGPFCHVHAGARLGRGTRLLSHVVVTGAVQLGASNVVHPFSVIGGVAQLRTAQSAASSGGQPSLVIGDHNVFRENVTINGAGDDGSTRLGSHNLFMAGSHVAHDVVVGSRCVVANGVQLAGHVVVDDDVTFGGLAGVAQHVRVGQGAFVAAGAMCERDVPPFVIVQGDRARVRAVNVVGLTRRHVPSVSIVALRRAFARLWGNQARGAVFGELVTQLDRSDPYVALLAAWLEAPVRAIPPAKRGLSAAPRV